MRKVLLSLLTASALTLAICVIFVVSSTSIRAEEPKLKAIDFGIEKDTENLPGRGFVPPSIKLPLRKPRIPAGVQMPLPTRFDWREQGKVTSIKEQGTCGSCYAFASLGCFESRILVEGGQAYDFSENNVKECEYWGSSCSGGNFWRVSSFLSSHGTVLESCDPYVASNVSCKSTCAYVKTLTDWREICSSALPSPDVLKYYLMTYGPLYVAMNAGHGDAWYGEFNNYDGSYTLYYEGPGAVNHAVLIVGWDDTLSHAGGQGAWIVKNSWGTDWGGPCGYGTEPGYFTIAYGSAQIGTYASFVYSWKDYDANDELLYYDEAGPTGYMGYTGYTTAWGLCKFETSQNAVATAIEFWTMDSCVVNVYLYDDFNGVSLFNLLASQTNIVYNEWGYHSVELSPPVDLSPGDPVYVAVKFSDASLEYPVAYDGVGPGETGKCYVSLTGSAWEAVDGYDLGIRLRINKGTGGHTWHVPGDASTIGAAIALASPGDSIRVAAGTYSEGNIAVNKNIVIMSESGPESTIVDAGGLYSTVFSLTSVGEQAILEGFTIKGAQSISNAWGILISSSSPIIRQCIITNCSGSSSGGIRITASSPQILNCTIDGNSGIAGVYFDSASDGTLDHCIISNTQSGVGIYCSGGANPVVSCCDIYGNDASNDICGTDGGGNFSEDPEFCDRASGNYFLRDSSPCLSGYGCGTIGALGQGCSSTLPDELVSFSVTALDERNKLRWQLPNDPNIDGAFIVYSTSGYPPSPQDGIPVENGASGYFPAQPSAVDSFYHTGLTNGVTYYYRAYTYSGTDFSAAGLTDSGTPSDGVPPANVTGFVALPGDREVILRWTCPTDSDFVGVVIRYSTSGYPVDETDGTPVENGAGGVFLCSPGQDTSFTHTGLTNSVTYYYSAFAFDGVPNYSARSTAAATPGDTIPPQPVSKLEIDVRDGALLIRWTNPSDSDFAGTVVRYSTVGFPSSPTDGIGLGDPTGYFYNTPASQDSFLHSGLTNGTTYYYSAFTFDGVPNFSTAVTDSATPWDIFPPASPSGFSSTSGDTTVTLRWTNPADSDFAYTLIRYATETYPQNPTDGLPVENGSDGIFTGEPASQDSFVHTGLTNGVTYYYSAFACDEIPNHSLPATTSSTPLDKVPPGPVTLLGVVEGDQWVKLRWQNPDDHDLDGVLIMYSTEAYPQDPTQGMPVENGSEGVFDASPASPDSFIHTSLTNDVTYYYSIFAFDEVPNYSSGVNVDATPFDQTPPEFSISVFQNPYITNHLDIYVVASEEVGSLTLTVGLDTLPTSILEPEEYLYRADYDLYSIGSVTIKACGKDLRLNYGCGERAFASGVVSSEGGTVSSIDQQFTIYLPKGALQETTYVLVWDEPGSAEKTYEVTPYGLNLRDFARVEFVCSDDTQLDQFSIARVDETTTVLDSYIDRDRRSIIAYTKELGIFKLVKVPNSGSVWSEKEGIKVVSSLPNPFNSSTSIIFDLARSGLVKVDILTIDGRLVKTVFSGVMSQGRHNLEWDGTDQRGQSVASGLYFCRLWTANATATEKLLLLR